VHGEDTIVSNQKRYDSYVICTSPRSGSTLLCRLLAATGKSGNPDSHFHSSSVSDWVDNYKIQTDQFANKSDLLTAIFQTARDIGTGNTGMFGLRLQRHSFNYFMQKLRVVCTDDSTNSDVDCIEKCFGKTLFVHLTRQNKLEQAISLVKATQTGLWHKAPDGTEIERLSAAREPTYDAHAIERKIAELTDMEAQWISWFADQGMTPLCINYDDLSDDPLGILNEVLQCLGIDQRYASGVKVPVAKLADKTNKLWATRFQSEQYDQNTGSC